MPDNSSDPATGRLLECSEVCCNVHPVKKKIIPTMNPFDDAHDKPACDRVVEKVKFRFINKHNDDKVCEADSR